jgi:alpha-tubulin suppressor-like RCC1 family protein
MKSVIHYFVCFTLLILSGCNKINIKLAKGFLVPNPSFSISHVSVSEGNNLVFTVELSKPLTTPSSVNFFTINGSALAGTHYSASSGVLTFAPGQVSRTITIPTTANPVELCAPDRILTVELSNAMGADLLVASANGTITDPYAPTISLSDSSVTEGSPVNFIASLSSACPLKDVTFNWTLTNGTVGSATITAGNLNTNISIPTVDDLIYQGTRTFSATLSSVVNATINDGVGTGTVLDNESVPVANFSVASSSVSESAGTATITVSLSHASAQITSVPFTLSGTATGSGTDYSITSSPVSISAGQTSATITVTIINDSLNELGETIILTMGAPTGATKGTTDAHTLTITDNDYARVSNVTSPDTNGTYTNGSLDIEVTFTENVTVTGTPLLNLNTTPARSASYVSGSGSSSLIFRYSIQYADAAADLDYVATSSLILSGGTITETLTTTNANLTLPTPGLAGSLGLNKNLVIATPPVATIASIQIPADDFYVTDDNLDFVFVFSQTVNVTGTPVLNLSIGGTPVSASYVSGSASTNLTFRYTAGGGVFGDGPVLTSPLNLSGGTIKDGYGVNATLTFTLPDTTGILVDTRSLVLRVTEPSRIIPEANGENNTITINLNPAPLKAFTIPLSFTGKATPVTDFDLDSTSVVIPAGQTSVTVGLDVFDNGTPENSKYFNILAERPNEKSNVTLSESYGSKVFILEDDSVKDRWVMVSTGYEHTCGINTAGKLKCWGRNGYYQLGDGSSTSRPDPVEIDSETYKSVMAGAKSTCGITTNNYLKCWGYNLYGQIGNGSGGVGNYVTTPVRIAPALEFKSVAINDFHSCAITTLDKLMCWGYNGSGQLGAGGSPEYSPIAVDSSEDYQSVTLGYSHTCGITTAGILKCWGRGDDGALGTGSMATKNAPFIIGVEKYKSVAAGSYHTCGITENDVLKCWGLNLDGSLGDGTTNMSLSPLTIDPGVIYKSVSAALRSTCGLDSLDRVKCWGANQWSGNYYGQLGTGDVTNRLTPEVVKSTNNFKSISARFIHACGITPEDTLSCWGMNADTQLGNGEPTLLTTPKKSETGIVFKALAADASHSCGIDSTDGLRCWGDNSSGQLGDGTKIIRSVPVKIDIGTQYKAISTRSSHSCGITTSNKLKCWGSNGSGQLGDGTVIERLRPKSIDAANDYKAVAVGTNFTCAITTANKLKCWGINTAYQLGDGTTSASLLPKPIDALNSYKTVAAGIAYACGINISDKLYCWGTNSASQLGDGTSTAATSPILIDGSISYKKVSLGFNHSCGITLADELRCWGNNLYGKLGDGSTTLRNLPVAIGGADRYKSVVLNFQFTCGITTADELKCWGSNTDGLIGLGAAVNATSPTLVEVSTYTSVAAGSNFGCGVTSLNELKCWGSNTSGQHGRNFHQFFPQAAGSY